jgi:hypothetical protein
MIDATWPHIESYSPTESDEHVLLKNLAARWLMDRGFPIDSIDDEKYVQTDTGGSGHTDVYAEQDDRKVYVECEVGQCRLSRGGSIPLNRGEDVFMFRRVDHDIDGIFRVAKEMREFEPSYIALPSEPKEAEVTVYHRLGDLPESPGEVNCSE